jgi:type IV pilus assembly protein PilW
MMKLTSFNRLKTGGFSLVELMVAMTISLIILAAVSTVFVSSKKTYSTQDRLARLQENARFAMQFITRDIRLAGYAGCVNTLIPKTTYFNQVNTSASLIPRPDIPLAGTDSTTDSVTISFVDPVTAASLNADMSGETSDITTTSTSGIAKGDVVLIADCTTADLFQVSDITTDAVTHITTIKHAQGTSNPAPGNSTNSLSKPYKATAKITKFVTRQYYIATGASGNPALWRSDNSAAGVELVDGIENLQILYGEDTDVVSPGTATDGVPNIYHNATAVGTNMGMVSSVRVGILAVTVNQKDSDIDTNAYDVDGDGITDQAAKNDHNTRRLFQSTVLLRNMRCKQQPPPAQCARS